jgi:phosphoribosylglycinamide formyltransferase-1
VAADIGIAVLASGSGTNLQVLIDTPGIGERLRLVISDKTEAKALNRANDAGIDTRVVRWEDFAGREEFSSAVMDAVDSAQCEVVVLAGFMRVLSGEAIDRYANRVINVHPSLLPAFPGTRAVEKALDHGAKVTGVTVHFVDELVDHGPIIAQAAVPVFPDDDRSTLHARIQIEEHRLLPEAVSAVVDGRIAVVDGTVIWDDA